MKVTIGRDPKNTIVVDERYDTVSSKHAEIELTADGRYLFIDHSTNGTMINNQKIHNGSMYVREGDQIFLANAFQVSWAEIKSKAPIGRATVQRNIHANPGVGGRETDQYAGRVQAPYVPPAPPMPPVQNNYGGQPTDEELSKWSWGGFLLGWIWALGNSVWWGLLGLLGNILMAGAWWGLPLFIVPVGFIVNIILGIRGTRSAWEATGGRMTFEAFKESQRKWTIAGVIVVGVGVLLWLVFFVVLAALL